MSVFRDKTEVVLLVLLLASLVLVTRRIGESDAIEYFSYLPSVLIDHDLDFEDEYLTFYREDPEGRAGFKETFLDRETATGLKINFGPIGSAVLWSPFYLVTHAVVRGDGMSQPYRTAITLASAFYGALGLWLSYRLARRYASAFVSFLAVVALWWATPVAYYMYIAPGMSHANSLFAVALFFALWPWARDGGVARWALWGASAGLMALVREQDGLFAVAALLTVLSPTLGLALVPRVKRLAVFGLTAFVVFVPQLVVYQILYGRPSPSPLVQRKMCWYSPHSLEVLFSPEHGLFFWSPILLAFLVGGLLFMVKKNREAGVILLAGFLSQVYISGAVDSWTQAGAFGSRRFVGATVLFAVWGAYLFALLEAKLRRVGLSAAVAFFLLWNVSLMVQFGENLMSRDRLEWGTILHNQIYVVPGRLSTVLHRYLFARDELQRGVP